MLRMTGLFWKRKKKGKKNPAPKRGAGLALELFRLRFCHICGLDVNLFWEEVAAQALCADAECYCPSFDFCLILEQVGFPSALCVMV